MNLRLGWSSRGVVKQRPKKSGSYPLPWSNTAAKEKTLGIDRSGQGKALEPKVRKIVAGRQKRADISGKKKWSKGP